mmetsp:Transcript_10293/g.14772  ORF Transcript_10293/g.14772 Transcript_10293/m.14772 type:complete len:559 (-) Transcript_10293:124-1800(-)
MQQASSAQAVLVPAQQTSSRVQIVCGGSSIKGRRPQQEDVLLIHTDTSSHSSSSQGDSVISHGEGKGMSIVGVFDGHGGKRCSRYAATHLPENFYAALGEMHSRAKSDSDKEDIMGSALRLAYRITHEDFARMARGDAETARPKTRQRLQEALDKAKAFDGIGVGGGGSGQGGIANAMHRSFPQPEDTSFAAIRNRMIQQRMSLGSRVWDDGSTAITCLVRGNSIMIANVGDSRAVASISGRAVALSVDHKPNLPTERARIQNAGGTVTSMMGCHRVMGMLAMSRALGDVMIERYLSVDPDLAEQQLEDRDFVVMASDGLWDVLSNQEVIHLVAMEATKSGWSPDALTAIANKLCMEAFRRGSMDNITVAIIMAVSDKEGGHSSSTQHNGGRGGGLASHHRDREIDSLNDCSLPSMGKKSALQRNSTLKGMGGAAGGEVRQSAGTVDLLRQRRDGSNSVVGSVGQRLAALAGLRDRGGESSSNGAGAAGSRRGQSLPSGMNVRQGMGQQGGAAVNDARDARDARSSVNLAQPSPLAKRPGGVVPGLGDMWKGRGIQKR